MKTEIIPVIHMLNEEQVFTNVNTCVECGIEKVFLINHKVSSDALMQCATKVRFEYRKLWVGANLLGEGTDIIEKEMPFLDGLWLDQTINPYDASRRKYKGMLFGGLAFKYQPQPIYLKEACEEAKLTTDVATTSGTGTGKPANSNKIKSIREYLGEHPMAVASGVSSENIESYKGIVNYLLVATSITDRNELIEKEKLSELISKIK